MSTLANYWRIITPASRKQMYTTLSTDAFDPRMADMSSVASVKWYTQVLRGAGSRAQSYKQYDVMDTDVDICRSLDIIAEEMSSKDSKTDLPFIIEYQKEDNEDISDSTVVTVRQALRSWSSLQALNKRMFSLARTMIKYGDCFFLKTSDTKKWRYIDPSLVYGIEVDEHGEKIAYHIKDNNTAQPSFGVKTETYTKVAAAAIIHFSMSDDMGDAAPFGASVLQPIYKVFRQLSMIEDAVIIYRIVRAPERRVFYIDTGNMPPQRVKQYLEQVKNEIRQKRAPSVSQNGKDTVDGSFDTASIQEDMFFPVTASGRGSRVETLPGGTEDFGSNLLKYFQDKIFRGLRIPTSYMSGADGQGAQYNDGKVGIAYIEEQRFANFISRLQNRLEDVLDQEFKVYLKVCGLQIDDEVFKIKLPEPANFAIYRQAALDTDLISSFKSIEDVKCLSRRFVLKRYLGLTDDEIQMNEVMVKEERSISDSDSFPPLQQMYDPAVYENRAPITVQPGEPSSELGTGGEFGADAGFGEMGTSDDMFSTAPSEEPSAELTPEIPEPGVA